MNIPNLFVVGAGQLGSRHLQALAKLDLPSKITVVDPSGDSLATSKSRIEEISGYEKHTFVYQTALENLGRIDLAIIATFANVRRVVVEELLRENEVANLVLEKVLFRRARDCADIGKLLERKGVDAWVNAPRRMWPFYQRLKKELSGETILSIKQSAGGWGMGCNAYHYLDLFAFLTEGELSDLSSDLLDRSLIESKRPGFKEVTGTLCGKFDNGAVFFISDYHGSSVSHTITIETDARVFVIDEINHVIVPVSGKRLPDGLVPMATNQSELTHLFAEEILTRGTCPLTSYHEASVLHQWMLRTFAVVFQPGENPEEAICPIT